MIKRLTFILIGTLLGAIVAVPYSWQGQSPLVRTTYSRSEYSLIVYRTIPSELINLSPSAREQLRRRQLDGFIQRPTVGSSITQIVAAGAIRTARNHLFMIMGMFAVFGAVIGELSFRFQRYPG